MGNSEVGHLNLGAGRIVYQDITRINLQVESGEFFSNQVLLSSAHHARDNETAWHLIGLVSNGGVHSSLTHLFALLELAKHERVEKVYVHALLDGRDTPPHSGSGFIRQVEQKMSELGVGRIATVCGRYWGMDRDQRWDRVERAYKMFIEGEGLRFSSPVEAVEDSYRRKITDEFVEPSVIVDRDKPVALLRDGDSVFFFNFRADRAREITRVFIEKDFSPFSCRHVELHYSTMTRYHEEFDLDIAFPPVHLDNILGQVISEAGLRQFRIAETEKYAHVTFFFNGGEETPFKGEERCLIQSPKVATYDLQPEMSAPEVCEKALKALDDGYNFMLLNFANPDMVGHTGILSATIQALEALDPLIEKLIEKATGVGYSVILTADHGNCEKMIDTGSEAHTAHTTNMVPMVVIYSPAADIKLRDKGILADVAPTILEMLHLPQPGEMEGKSMIINNT